MARIPVQILIGLLLCGPAWAQEAQNPSDARCLQTASQFLARLDHGDYRAAWAQTTPLFQTLHNEKTWVSTQQVLHKVYGPLARRQMTLLSHRNTYAHSPDGNYVIIQYETAFQHKAETNETIVLDCRTEPDCQIREYVLR